MYMLIQVAEEDVVAVGAAVFGFAIGEPLLLEQWSPAPVKGRGGQESTPANVGVDEGLAVRVADALRPTSRQPLRRDTLRVFFGKEHIQDGVFLRHSGGNDALRNGMVAVAKALRPFVPEPLPPIELLARREKEYVGGGYRRTVYKLNALGERVRAIMEESGHL